MKEFVSSKGIRSEVERSSGLEVKLNKEGDTRGMERRRDRGSEEGRVEGRE